MSEGWGYPEADQRIRELEAKVERLRRAMQEAQNADSEMDARRILTAALHSTEEHDAAA